MKIDVEILLPYPSKPFVVSEPKWLTDPPDLFWINDRLAITLGKILWRNRFGFIEYVPPGLPHDGESLFWPASCIWDRWDIRDRQAVALHDKNYACHDFVRNWPVTRKQADFNLVDGFKLSKTGGARIRYIAVKLGGETIWRNVPNDALMVGWLKAVAAGPGVLKAWIKSVKKVA